MSGLALLSDRYQYHLYTGYTDMRKQFDGLCGIVRNELGREVTAGDVFIFVNKRGSHIKLLLKEADGMTMLYRRLHKGRFQLPDMSSGGASIRMNATDLLSLLSGLRVHRWQKGSLIV